MTESGERIFRSGNNGVGREQTALDGRPDTLAHVSTRKTDSIANDKGIAISDDIDLSAQIVAVPRGMIVVVTNQLLSPQLAYEALPMLPNVPSPVL